MPAIALWTWRLLNKTDAATSNTQNNEYSSTRSTCHGYLWGRGKLHPESHIVKPRSGKTLFLVPASQAPLAIQARPFTAVLQVSPRLS